MCFYNNIYVILRICLHLNIYGATELKRVDYQCMDNIHSKAITQEWTSTRSNKHKSLILLLGTWQMEQWGKHVNNGKLYSHYSWNFLYIIFRLLYWSVGSSCSECSKTAEAGDSFWPVVQDRCFLIEEKTQIHTRWMSDQ